MINLPPLKHLTFDEMKASAAQDLRDFAAIVVTRANEVENGDMDAFYKLVSEEFSNCLQMLLIRQGYRAERREISPTEPGSAT